MLLGAGEDGIFTTLLIGCAASYILDLLRYPEMTLVCVWLTLFSIYLAMLIESDLFFAPLRPTIISLFLLTTNGIMLFLCGLWASLQFKWVEREHPNVSRWMESVHRGFDFAGVRRVDRVDVDGICGCGFSAVLFTDCFDGIVSSSL